MAKILICWQKSNYFKPIFWICGYSQMKYPNLFLIDLTQSLSIYIYVIIIYFTYETAMRGEGAGRDEGGGGGQGAIYI